MSFSDSAKIGIVIFVALFNYYLGALVFSQKRKSLVNFVFCIIAWSFATWAICLGLYEHPIIFTSEYWVFANYFFVVLFIACQLWFSFLFPISIVSSRKKGLMATLGIIIYLSISYWLLFGTNLWIVRVVHDPVRGLQTILGPGYMWWVVVTWFAVCWSVINFLVKSKRATSTQKIQMRYYWIGFIAFSIVVNVPDVIVPLIWHDTRFFTWSVLGNLCYSVTVAYIILRHRFLDIHALLVRSAAYFISTIVLGALYVGGMIVFMAAISPGPLVVSRFILSTVFTFGIAFTFQPVLRFFQKATVKIFYQEYYTIDEFFASVSQVMATKLELNTLMCGVLEVIQKYIHTTSSTIIVNDKESDYVIESSSTMSLHMSIVKEDLDVLKANNRLLVYEEMGESKQKEIMKKHDIGLFMPLATKQAAIGYLLLGEKSSGDVYFSQDVKALQIMAPELAIALENAQSYQKIKIFNETLKVEVASATKDLRSANAHLKQLDQLKDEFISIASHELRTPLTTLKGFLELELKEPEKLSYDSRNHLERAYASSERMIGLVNDMLDVSRIESGRMTFTVKSCDMQAGVAEVIAEEEAHIKEKHAVVEVVGGENISVLVDCTRMHQVLLNLIDNALKFIPDGGKVTITCKESDKEASFSVSDNGPGIRKEDYPRLFTKFGKLGTSYSSMSETRGTGLGLYICKKLVELQHGKISMTSEVGKGSTFTVTVPKAMSQYGILPENKKSDTL